MIESGSVKGIAIPRMIKRKIEATKKRKTRFCTIYSPWVKSFQLILNLVASSLDFKNKGQKIFDHGSLGLAGSAKHIFLQGLHIRPRQIAGGIRRFGPRSCSASLVYIPSYSSSTSSGVAFASFLSLSFYFKESGAIAFMPGLLGLSAPAFSSWESSLPSSVSSSSLYSFSFAHPEPPSV